MALPLCISVGKVERVNEESFMNEVGGISTYRNKSGTTKVTAVQISRIVDRDVSQSLVNFFIPSKWQYKRTIPTNHVSVILVGCGFRLYIRE